MDTPGPGTNERRSALMEAGVIALLAAVVFSVGLGRVGLFEPDEARYAVVAKGMAQGGPLLVPHIAEVPYLGKPPLVFWLTAFAMKIFGYSEVSARIPSIFFAVMTVMMLYGYLLSRRGTGCARMAAAVLVTCPFFWGLARTGLTDMPFTAFVTAAFLSAHLAMDSEKPGRWRAAMYAALGLAVMSKTFAALPLLAGAVGLEAVFRRSGKPFRVFISPAGVALFLLISLPWFIALGIHNCDYLRHILFERNLAAFFSETWSRSGRWWLYAAVITGGMLPWTAFILHAIVRARPWRKADRENAPDAFAFSCALAVIVFYSFSRTKVVTYVLPAFPALAILAAISIERLRVEQFRKLAHVAFAFPVLFGLAFAVFAFFQNRLVLHGSRVEVLGTLRMVAAAWTVFAAAAWLLAFKGTRDVAFRCLIAAAGTMIVGVLMALPEIDGAVTSRPHSKVIRQVAPPEFRIVDSGSETLGPAFYTGARLYFIGKKVNLAFGKNYADPAIFDPDLAAWHRDGIVFFFIIRPEAGALKTGELGVPLYEIARPGRLAVMTNDRSLAGK